MSFRISDHVVCVDDREPSLGWSPLHPVKNGVQYVISDVWEDEDVGVLVQLTGLPEGDVPYGRAGYAPERFRKLEEIQSENRAKAYCGASPPQRYCVDGGVFP